MCVYEPAALSLRWPGLLLRAFGLNGAIKELTFGRTLGQLGFRWFGWVN